VTLPVLFLGPLFLVLSWIAWAGLAVLSLGYSVQDVLVRRRTEDKEGLPELQPMD